MPATSFPNSVDSALIQDANYRFNSADRQYIDSQIRAIQEWALPGDAIAYVGANSPFYRTDGTADQIQINQAITDISAAGGGVVHLMPGVFSTLAPVIMKSNVWLRGPAKIVASADWDTDVLGPNTALIMAVGTDGNTMTLTSDVDLGDQTVNVVAGTAFGLLNVGDYAVLMSEEIWDPITSTSPRKVGEFVKVFAKGAASFDIMGIARHQYLVADSAQARKINFVENIKISDLDLSQATAKLTKPDIGSCVLLQKVRNATVTGCKMHDWDGQGVGIVHSIFVRVYDNTIHNLSDLADDGYYGYGVVVGGCSEDIIVKGNTFSHLRHGFTTGLPRAAFAAVSGFYGIVRNVVVSGNTASRCTSVAFDTHAWSEDVLIEGNVAHNIPTWAFYCRGRGTHVKDNIVTFCSNGINVGIGKTSSGGPGTGSSVTGNIIRHIKIMTLDVDDGVMTGTGDAIQVNETDNVTVANNIIEGCDNHGILLGTWSRYCVVSKNIIINANLLGSATGSAIALSTGFNHGGQIAFAGTTCTWSYTGNGLAAGTNPYMAGQKVIISGSSTPTNNGTFTILTVAYDAGLNKSTLTYTNASGATDAGTVLARIENVTDCTIIDNLAQNTTSTFDVDQTGLAKYLVFDDGVNGGGGGEGANIRNKFINNRGFGMVSGLFNAQHSLSHFVGNSPNEGTPVLAVAGAPSDASFSTTPLVGTLAMNSTTGELSARGQAVWDVVSGINKALTSDFTTTLDTATDTLLSFPMKSGETWQFEIKATVGCSGAGGVKFQHNAPGGSTLRSWIEAVGAGITQVFRQQQTTINALNSSAANTNGSAAPNKIWGVVTAGADGNFTLGVASVTAGQTTTVYSKSSIRARKVTLV